LKTLNGSQVDTTKLSKIKRADVFVILLYIFLPALIPKIARHLLPMLLLSDISFLWICMLLWGEEGMMGNFNDL